MPLDSDAQPAISPENLLGRVARRLQRIAFWDSVLLIVPPTAVIVYFLLTLSHAAILERQALIIANVGAVALAVLLFVWRYRPLVPNPQQTAQLVDQRTAAKDRFLTLSTIELKLQPADFMARLRQESEAYGRRIQLTQDFPYKFKRSVIASLLVSVIAAGLIHFLMPQGYSAIQPLPATQQLRDLAEKMSVHANLAPVAAQLRELARKFDDPKIPPEEKQAQAQDVQEKIEQQIKENPPPQERELLGEASSTVAGMEKQQSSSGHGQQEQQQQGGGIQSNQPQDGESEGKQSQGGSGDSQGNKKTAEANQDMQQGKSAKGDPKEKGKETSRNAKGTAEGTSPEPNKPGEEKGQETKGKGQRTSKDAAGRNRVSEGPPQGRPPTDRLAKPGEQSGGLKGAGYVTVQLPEEAIPDAAGKTKSSKESAGGRNAANVPVTNVPLPAHVPNAPTEKQQVPLEYRGIIR